MVIYEQGKFGQHSQTSKEGSKSDHTLNWIPFYRESHIKQCALIYKRLKGNTPNYLNELLVINSSMHTRNTRYCNLNLFCPRYSYATEGGRSFTFRSIRDWNSLPRSLS